VLHRNHPDPDERKLTWKNQVNRQAPRRSDSPPTSGHASSTNPQENVMSSLHRLSAALLIIVGLGGCSTSSGGTGSSGATPGTTVLVKTYYDAPANTQLAAEGLVLVGADGQPSTVKHGWWKRYYPPTNGNGLQDEMIYVHDAWDEQDFWTRYNPDSSIQDAMIDELY
jgi:hypothetical protein